MGRKEVKIEDYRIGNLIMVGDKEQKLTLKMLCAATKNLNGIKPIEITGERLLKLGFRFVPNVLQKQVYYREGFHITLMHGMWVLEAELVSSYKYIHEIQNVIYATIKEEV